MPTLIIDMSSDFYWIRSVGGTGTPECRKSGELLLCTRALEAVIFYPITEQGCTVQSILHQLSGSLAYKSAFNCYKIGSTNSLVGKVVF